MCPYNEELIVLYLCQSEADCLDSSVSKSYEKHLTTQVRWFLQTKRDASTSKCHGNTSFPFTHQRTDCYIFIISENGALWVDGGGGFKNYYFSSLKKCHATAAAVVDLLPASEINERIPSQWTLESC